MWGHVAVISLITIVLLAIVWLVVLLMSPNEDKEAHVPTSAKNVIDEGHGWISFDFGGQRILLFRGLMGGCYRVTSVVLGPASNNKITKDN